MNQIYWVTDKYTSNLNISLQLSIYQSFQWRTVKYHFNYTSIYLWIDQKLKLINYEQNLLSVWQIHIILEHFIVIVYISVISMKTMKNYQISLRLTSNYLRSIWNMNEYNICTKFIEHLTIQFEFEQSNAIVYIPIISMKNYQISPQLNIKSIPINIKFELMQYMHQI